MFFVQAIARDGGTPARKSETIVTINVEESNNKPPKFRMVSTLLSDLLDSSSICQKSHGSIQNSGISDVCFLTVPLLFNDLHPDGILAVQGLSHYGSYMAPLI